MSQAAAATTAAAPTQAARFDGMTEEQVKASVYGAAGDVADDRITAPDMRAIVEDAAPRLSDASKASLEKLLRAKLSNADVDVDEVVAPLSAAGR